MKVLLDDQFRLQIPKELREQFDFKPGSAVDVRLQPNGLEVTPLAESITAADDNGELVWKQGVLVFRHHQPVSPFDQESILETIDKVRLERVEHILGNHADR